MQLMSLSSEARGQGNLAQPETRHTERSERPVKSWSTKDQEGLRKFGHPITSSEARGFRNLCWPRISREVRGFQNPGVTKDNFSLWYVKTVGRYKVKPIFERCTLFFRKFPVVPNKPPFPKNFETLYRAVRRKHTKRTLLVYIRVENKKIFFSKLFFQRKIFIPLYILYSMPKSLEYYDF